MLVTRTDVPPRELRAREAREVGRDGSVLRRSCAGPPLVGEVQDMAHGIRV